MLGNRRHLPAFLTTPDGVVLLDAPPTIGHNIQRAVDEIASANGVSNKVTFLIYSHHHADHGGASFLFDKDVTRIGHEKTRRLLLRGDDPARPPNEETFADRRTRPAHGFLLVALDRPDVFLSGDLALRHAVQHLYGLDHLPSEVEMVEIGEKWRPYRSLAVSYLFASEFQGPQ